MAREKVPVRQRICDHLLAVIERQVQIKQNYSLTECISYSILTMRTVRLNISYQSHKRRRLKLFIKIKLVIGQFYSHSKTAE